MSKVLRGLRGATTVDADTVEDIDARVQELVAEMIARNGLEEEDIVSILFTATDDIHAAFPATSARARGLGDVPFICARELDIVGGAERCIRVLMHVMSSRSKAEIHHVYFHGAVGLRDDLPE